MKSLIQRVASAKVSVDDNVVGEISSGLLVLVCAEHDDGKREVELLARKVANLRIFEDDDGKMNLSVRDIGGSVLVVSQFTLAADVRRGNRPGFSAAANPEVANELFETFCTTVAAHEIPVEKGSFGAHMAVSLVNDGPVTIWIDTQQL